MNEKKNQRRLLLVQYLPIFMSNVKLNVFIRLPRTSALCRKNGSEAEQL